MGESEAQAQIKRGYRVSSAFTLWQGEGEERKGRFVVNFSVQSNFWEKESVRTDRMEEFASEMREVDRLLSFDLTAGYRHVRLNPL